MTQMSPDKITRHALILIDQEGSVFSMRRLGKELGVDAKAVYYYFPSKSNLINAVLQLALTEMTLPDLAKLAWQEQLRVLAREYYNVATNHPNLIPFMMRVDGTMPAAFDVVEHLVSALATTPLKPTSIVQIIDLFLGFLPSFASGTPAEGDDQDTLLGAVQALPETTYPAIKALAGALGKTALVEDIDLQISIVLWGIEALIEKEGTNV